MNITLCDCPICNEKDCKVCLEPQYCECKCGTCEDARSMMIPDEDDDVIMILDKVDYIEMAAELMNDIEKDGQ